MVKERWNFSLLEEKYTKRKQIMKENDKLIWKQIPVFSRHLNTVLSCAKTKKSKSLPALILLVAMTFLRAYCMPAEHWGIWYRYKISPERKYVWCHESFKMQMMIYALAMPTWWTVMFSGTVMQPPSRSTEITSNRSAAGGPRKNVLCSIQQRSYVQNSVPDP